VVEYRRAVLSSNIAALSVQRGRVMDGEKYFNLSLKDIKK
jgi:hypothetical protein